MCPLKKTCSLFTKHSFHNSMQTCRHLWKVGTIIHFVQKRPKTPEQLWRFGLMCNPVNQPENLQDIQEPDIDWDDYTPDADGVVVVPEFNCPLDDEAYTRLKLYLDENRANTRTRELYLLCRECVHMGQ
ncbi:unnamed protein product [Knipowitschia caucasica]